MKKSLRGSSIDVDDLTCFWVNGTHQSQIVRALFCACSSENDDMIPQDVSVLRRNLLLQDIVLCVHFHSGYEMNPVFCPFTELGKVPLKEGWSEASSTAG